VASSRRWQGGGWRGTRMAACPPSVDNELQKQTDVWSLPLQQGSYKVGVDFILESENEMDPLRI
jgi:hypothetical protein